MKTKGVQLIVAMKGHPGTGKSTLAQSLARSLEWPLIDKDDVKNCTASLQSSNAADHLNDLSYEVIWRIAATQLHLGLSVVVDSPLSRRAHLDRLLRLAAAAGAQVLIVECRPRDQAEWCRRLETRGASGDASWHKPSTWQDLERLVEGYAGCSEFDVGDVPKQVVDTTAAGAGVEELVSDVLQFIFSHAGRKCVNQMCN